jgi:hypothetical protein
MAAIQDYSSSYTAKHTEYERRGKGYFSIKVIVSLVWKGPEKA